MTVRELLSLNGFPPDFKLPGRHETTNTVLRGQAGNAVPPIVWQKFMLKVKESLQDFADGKIDEAGNRIPLRDIDANVNGAINRMRQVSLEPRSEQLCASRMRPQRPQSVTLSPDLPATPPNTRHQLADTDAPTAQRVKRKYFISLLDEEEVTREAKLRRQSIDLTRDD